MSISGVTTQIRTTDLDGSIDFYVSDEKDPSIDFVSKGDHLHLYFITSGLESKAKQLEGNGVLFFKAISETQWGKREFAVKDNQGHILYFGQHQ